MGDIREVHAGPLPPLEDLLWEWVTIQERSIRLWRGKDASWWYNERASLGGFAGAVWRVGGLVLEEYSTEKWRGKHVRHAPRRRTVGRGDMDFVLGGRQFVVEAKQCWPLLGSTKPLRHAVWGLAAAQADVARANAAPGSVRLAVVFAAPRSQRRTLKLEAQVADWIEAAGSVRTCARAWAFPEKGSRLWWPKTGRYYPGAAVFIKLVGRTRLPA
jgi:hypothetical protein